jgi:hypothetical protein
MGETDRHTYNVLKCVESYINQEKPCVYLMLDICKSVLDITLCLRNYLEGERLNIHVFRDQGIMKVLHSNHLNDGATCFALAYRHVQLCNELETNIHKSSSTLKRLFKDESYVKRDFADIKGVLAEYSDFLKTVVCEKLDYDITPAYCNSSVIARDGNKGYGRLFHDYDAKCVALHDMVFKVQVYNDKFEFELR